MGRLADVSFEPWQRITCQNRWSLTFSISFLTSRSVTQNLTSAIMTWSNDGSSHGSFLMLLNVDVRSFAHEPQLVHLFAFTSQYLLRSQETHLQLGSDHLQTWLLEQAGTQPLATGGPCELPWKVGVRRKYRINSAEVGEICEGQVYRKTINVIYVAAKILVHMMKIHQTYQHRLRNTLAISCAFHIRVVCIYIFILYIRVYIYMNNYMKYIYIFTIAICYC